MKLRNIIFTLLMAMLVSSFFVPATAEARSYRTRSSDVHVRSYYRRSGVYVPSHYRSRADGYKWNNYSCIDKGRC